MSTAISQALVELPGSGKMYTDDARSLRTLRIGLNSNDARKCGTPFGNLEESRSCYTRGRVRKTRTASTAKFVLSNVV